MGPPIDHKDKGKPFLNLNEGSQLAMQVSD